jgi:hypothetical protein
VHARHTPELATNPIDRPIADMPGLAGCEESIFKKPMQSKVGQDGFTALLAQVVRPHCTQPILRALSALAHMHVDVEVDVADAGLRDAVRAAFVPAAGAGARVPDTGKPQAAPLRQRP